MRRSARKSRTKRPLLLPGPAGTGGKPYDLRERTLVLAVRILEIADVLPASRAAQVLQHQMVRAGTSVGANVEEADGAFSKADKRRSFIIARKEARELRFWLRVIGRRWPSLADLKEDLQESTEIISILSSIIARLS